MHAYQPDADDIRSWMLQVRLRQERGVIRTFIDETGIDRKKLQLVGNQREWVIR